MKSREEFLKERKHYIGGSDIAPILGMSKYKNAIEVFNEKTDRFDYSEETEVIIRGRETEPIVAQRYIAEDMAENERLIYPAPQKICPVCSRLGVHVDGVIVDKETEQIKRLLEIKTTGHDEFIDKHDDPDEWIKKEQPDWWWQLQGEMLAWCDTLVPIDLKVMVIGNGVWRTLPAFTVYPSDKDFTVIRNSILDFWTYVEKDEPPVHMVSKYQKPVTIKSGVYALPEGVGGLCERRMQLSEQVKSLEKEKDAIEDKIEALFDKRDETVFQTGKLVITKSVNTPRKTLSPELVIASIKPRHLDEELIKQKYHDVDLSDCYKPTKFDLEKCKLESNVNKRYSYSWKRLK